MSYKDKDEFYPKYLIIRRSDCKVYDGKETFTLLPNSDPHAKVALQAYCNSCAEEMPGLVRMLRKTFNL